MRRASTSTTATTTVVIVVGPHGRVPVHVRTGQIRQIAGQGDGSAPSSDVHRTGSRDGIIAVAVDIAVGLWNTRGARMTRRSAVDARMQTKAALARIVIPGVVGSPLFGMRGAGRSLFGGRH